MASSTPATANGETIAHSIKEDSGTVRTKPQQGPRLHPGPSSASTSGPNAISHIDDTQVEHQHQHHQLVLIARDYNHSGRVPATTPFPAAAPAPPSPGFVHQFDDCQTQGQLHFANCSTAAATTSGPPFFGPSQADNNNTNDAAASAGPHLFQAMNLNHEELEFAHFERVWLVKPWPEILLRVCFVVPILLLGILGNLTIIYSIAKFKRFRTKPTNIFILNMAVADLLTTVVCPTAALFTDVHQFYVLGAFLCRFEGFIKITCLLVSAYSLIVLSYDWLLSVVRPCRTRISIRQSWLALASIWLASILVASPLFVWRRLRERQWRDLLEVWCCELIQYTKYYWICITFLLIYLPTLIMTIVLVVILAQMDQFEAKLRRSRASGGGGGSGQKPPLPPPPPPPQPPVATSQQLASQASSSASSSSLSINMKYRRRIVKILFTYLLTSMICWTPLQFTIIYRHFRSEAVPAQWYFELVFFAQLCASLSSAMNPIIFGFLSQPFRHIVTKSWLFRLLDKMMTSQQNNQSNQNQNQNNQNQNNHNQNHNNYPMNQRVNHINVNHNLKSPHQQQEANGQPVRFGHARTTTTTRDNTHTSPKLTIESIEPKLKPSSQRQTSFTTRPTSNTSDHIGAPSQLTGQRNSHDSDALNTYSRHRHHQPRAASMDHLNHHKHVKLAKAQQHDHSNHHHHQHQQQQQQLHHTANKGQQQKSVSSSDQLTEQRDGGGAKSPATNKSLSHHKRRKEVGRPDRQLSGRENEAYDNMGDSKHDHNHRASTSGRHHTDKSQANGRTKPEPDQRASPESNGLTTNGINVTSFMSVKSPAAKLDS